MSRAIEIAVAIVIIVLAVIAGSAPTVPPSRHPLPAHTKTADDDQLVLPAAPVKAPTP